MKLWEVGKLVKCCVNGSGSWPFSRDTWLHLSSIHCIGEVFWWYPNCTTFGQLWGVLWDVWKSTRLFQRRNGIRTLTWGLPQKDLEEGSPRQDWQAKAVHDFFLLLRMLEWCVTCLLHCWDKMTDQNYSSREKKLYLGFQVEGSVHHSQEVLMASDCKNVRQLVTWVSVVRKGKEINYGIQLLFVSYVWFRTPTYRSVLSIFGLFHFN